MHTAQEKMTDIYRKVALANVHIVSKYEVAIIAFCAWFHRPKIDDISDMIKNLFIQMEICCVFNTFFFTFNKTILANL